MSCEHIQTLKTNIEEEVRKLYGQVNEQSKAKLQVKINEFYFYKISNTSTKNHYNVILVASG